MLHTVLPTIECLKHGPKPWHIPSIHDVDGIYISKSYSLECLRSAIRYNAQPSDIFIVTYPKCGTTWTQHIVYNIINNHPPPRDQLLSWIEMPFLEAQGAESIDDMKKPGPIKTHLPFRLPTCSKEAKYIYVARNSYDSCVSFSYHTRGMPEYNFQNGTFSEFLEMLLEGKVDYGDYFAHLLSWYEHRDDPNVLFVTYEQLQEDIRVRVLKIADFIGEEYGLASVEPGSLLANRFFSNCKTERRTIPHSSSCSRGVRKSALARSASSAYVHVTRCYTAVFAFGCFHEDARLDNASDRGDVSSAAIARHVRVVPPFKSPCPDRGVRSTLPRSPPRHTKVFLANGFPDANMRIVCIALIALAGVAAAKISIPLRKEKITMSNVYHTRSEEVGHIAPLNYTQRTAPLYDNRQSSTYGPYGIWVTAPYIGGGAITGTAAYETITVAGINVTNQLFVEATVIDPKIYNGVYFDGAIGLSIESRYLSQHWSIFDNMFINGLLPVPVFAFYFHPTVNGTDGELVLGGIEKSHYEGELTYAQSATDEWLIRLQGVKVGLRWLQTEYVYAKPVSTLPYIYGPQSDIESINKALNATKTSGEEYVVECSNITALPIVSIKISGKTFDLRPQDYIVELNSTCYSGFVVDEDHQLPNASTWLLGQNFLRRVYTIFKTGIFLWDKQLAFAYARDVVY
ncbi:hypothetical protein MTO96_019271 [Rhipicephalus appendiculatus]